MSERQHHTVVVEAHIGEPALAPATFDLLRLCARASSLNDVGQIFVTLRVEFHGQCHESQVSAFQHRLDQLWIADVVEHTIKEKNPTQQQSNH